MLVMFLFNSASLVKTRDPEDKQLCIAVDIIYNIHDTNPLDIQDN